MGCGGLTDLVYTYGQRPPADDFLCDEGCDFLLVCRSEQVFRPFTVLETKELYKKESKVGTT
jgi:hypothetical protein